MEYIQGQELENFLTCIKRNPKQVKTALDKMVDGFNIKEKKYQEQFPDFIIAKAVKLDCNNDPNTISHLPLSSLPQKEYLSEFEGFNIQNFDSKIKNVIIDSFDPKYFNYYDYYAVDDLSI
jgi:hypothetical protein